MIKKSFITGIITVFIFSLNSCTSEEDNAEVKGKTSIEVLSVKEGPGDDPVPVQPPKK